MGFLSGKMAAIINNVLFVHAGIASRMTSVESLADRNNEQIILWSDPVVEDGNTAYVDMAGKIIGEPQRDDWFNFRRQAGVVYTERASEKVLAATNTKIIIWSHDPRLAENGPHAMHSGQVITVNACRYYGVPFLLKLDTLTVKYKAIYEGKGGYKLRQRRRKQV